MTESETSLPSHYTWLIPVDTRPSQCLHVCIKKKEGNESVHVVVSDYECLHGHRASHLMAEMVSGTDTHYHIDIEEPPECDVLKALQFMHADVPALDLSHCTALSYAHTAHFLDMRRLGDEVVACASAVLHTMATTSPLLSPGTDKNCSRSSSGDDGDVGDSSPADPPLPPQISPWDAIAALTLLGDPQHALGRVNLQEWYQRDPRLFEHPDLFSSCHFFGPQKFASIVKMINENNFMDRAKHDSLSKEQIRGYSTIASTLKADLLAVLRAYVGKQVLARRPPSTDNAAQRPHTQHVSGTVVNSFIEKDRAYVVVEWHVTATKSIIALRQFVQSGQFKMLESAGGNCTSARFSSLQLKRRGGMKYT